MKGNWFIIFINLHRALYKHLMKEFYKLSKILKVLSLIFATVLFLLVPEPAHAYIGPGAGFAFITSFFVLFASIGFAILILITAPMRFLIRALRGKGRRKGPVDRVVVLGLDGMDPGLTGEMMDAGELPNFKKLSEEGCFSPLLTSNPAMSPVAWSSFMTGVSPAKHNIFDFLTPDRKSYYPALSSSEILPSRKSLKIGGLTIPIGKPVMRLLRKGKPFWKVLSENGIFSSVLRVPITFPPEPFGGHLLSAMCVPDLKGTQGSFTLYTSQPEETDIYEGGERVRVSVAGKKVVSQIVGPANSMKENGGALTIPFTFSISGPDSGVLELGGKKHKLRKGEFSAWIELSFKAPLGVKVSGIARFYLKNVEPVFELYMTPINIDPGNPALPVSHPFVYSIYLEKRIGKFATLGLAEDTWALNERITDEETFLQQCWLNHQEREDMFFLALRNTKRGTVTCVFDATDRIQHMFWRYHEKCDFQPLDNYEKYKNTIRDLYKRMDALLAKTVEQLGKKDVLIVMSDHGFKSFRRGVDLNAWLEKEGYLTRKKDATGEKFLKDVDWSKTRAYSLGLSGIYINQKGREAQGIVEREQSPELRKEIAAKINGMKDAKTGETAVNDAADFHELMSGPYMDNCPDVFVGYNIGYRASWDCAVGKINDEVFEDNTKSWSGDHCIDPKLAPGIFLSNKKINGGVPHIMDIAPSILSQFGVKAPAFMEGKNFFKS